MNEKLAFILIHAAHAIEERFDEALAAVDLSGPKFAALSVLVAEDQPLSLGELAAKLTCVRSNITQLVDRLEKDGLVKRTDDPTDRRGVRAEVTNLGRERQAAGARVTEQIHESVEKQFSEADRKFLTEALKSIS